jgi:uncharacterized damage-inducible protein DinB
MNAEGYLAEIRDQFRRQKTMGERAAAQVGEEDFFASLGANPQSIAILMKHQGGNLRSRWRDFLTTDGEKPDRDRESEFSVEGETRASIESRWQAGWRIALDAIDALRADDLERIVTIRGEPHTVVQALQRGLAHAAYHTGQIVLLVRHFAGEAWQTLSIAPGKSDEFNAAMRARNGEW